MGTKTKSHQEVKNVAFYLMTYNKYLMCQHCGKKYYFVVNYRWDVLMLSSHAKRGYGNDSNKEDVR